MFPITSMRRIALAAAVALTASCGGGGDEAAPATPSSPDAKAYLPTVVHVDAANRVVELGADPAAPPPGVAGNHLVRGDRTDRTDSAPA